MARLEMSYATAHAAALDAGNRSMRAAGRDQWDLEDWLAASREFGRLWPEDPNLNDVEVKAVA